MSASEPSKAVNQVIGMETVNAMLDRYRPEWAKGKPLSEFTG